MGKYEPLNAFLKGRMDDMVAMTFAQIEQVLGERLPPSKKQRAWWSNNRNNNVMTKEWLDAGFETESVDIAGEKLVFRRVASKEGKVEHAGFEEAAPSEFQAPGHPVKHPGFGFMKGLMTLADDFDPTEPSLPDWDDYAERKYGKDSKLHE